MNCWIHTHTNKERSAGPCEGGGCIEVGRGFEYVQFVFPDSRHLLLKRNLPRIQLDHLEIHRVIYIPQSFVRQDLDTVHVFL